MKPRNKQSYFIIAAAVTSLLLTSLMVNTIQTVEIDIIQSPTAHDSGLPKADDIYFKGYPGATPDVIVNEFIDGVTDMIEGPWRSDLFDSVINAGHSVSEFRPAAKFMFFPINNRDYKYSSGDPNAPLNDSNWRLALSYVYGIDDKQVDVSGYYGVPWVEALGNPVPPAQEPWYDAATVMPNSDNATAWAILSGAGYSIADYGGQQWLHRNGVPVRPPDGPNGGVITCLYPTGYEVYPQGPLGGMARNWNSFIQGYVGAEGPLMTLIPTDYVTTLVALFLTRDYDIIGAELTDLGRYVNWIYAVCHSSNDVPWGWNFCGIHDADYDRWAEIILTSMDANEVQEACENWTRKFVFEEMNWMPAVHGLEFVTTCNNTLEGNHDGILTNVIPMDNHGSLNDYTWMCLHWAGTPGVDWPGGSYNVALRDEADTLNPWTEYSQCGWQYMDRTIMRLCDANPSDNLNYKLKLMPMVATKWSLTNWTSIPALGITNGSIATFYLRQDVLWHDLEEVDAYDCVANLRFMRTYEPGRYSSTWEHLVYEEADGPYKFNAYFDQTSLYYADLVAGTALLVPEHVIEVVEGYWQTWDPSQEDYSDLGFGLPPTKYSFMKQLVGCGPFVFHNYDRGTVTGRVTRFEEFFVNAPVIGGVVGEWRVDPGDDYTYEVNVQNFGAKEANTYGEITGVEVDVAIFEDGVPVHIVNDTYLGGWEWVRLGPYTKTGVSCGPHDITVVITGNPFFHRYTHKFVATIREDVTTYSGERIDFTVDARDIIRVGRAYRTSPGHLRWDPACDVNNDFVVNIIDLACICKRFGWTGGSVPSYPPLVQPYQVYLVVNSSKTVVCSTCNVTFSVYIINVTKFMGYDITLGYDSGLLELVDGKVISPFGGSVVEVEGYLAISSLAAPFNGSACIAELNFTAKAKGEALLNPSTSLLVSGCQVSMIPYIPVTARINVTMLGDITGPDSWPDGKCDMRDIGLVAIGFGANRVTNETDPRYGEYWHPTPCDICPHSPNCDVVYDGKIDMRDIGTVARHFGETDP